MFKRLLIANRGEIAHRIIRTARRLGVETLAVYAPVDASSPHVQAADHALPLAGTTAAETYLNGEALCGIVARYDVDAVHPGYGFLSEQAPFARAVHAAGACFVGPEPETIELMGSKATAKAAALAARVPVIPGMEGASSDPQELAAAAAELGYPLLLKAVMGGGGRGMRLVRSDADFHAALESAQREARAAFGDDAMLLERYLRPARHVEVQIFGDGTGGTVHLFDRDCSMQRRYQKVIEEAPALDLHPELRGRMLDAAVRLAEHVQYLNAGTVEFAVQGDECFFLEMNTRLQVEHPVTEAVTGVDLVEWQLRVAAERTLPVSQEKIRCSGHALEVRLCAEVPEDGFRVATGVLHGLRWPADVRVDAGVAIGSEVSSAFDSMIAKFVAHADSRDAVIAAVNTALGELQVVGLETNAAYLQGLLCLDAFQRFEHHTTLIDEGRVVAPFSAQLPAAALALALTSEVHVSTPPWLRQDGFQAGLPSTLSLRCVVGVEPVTVVLEGDALTLNGDRYVIERLAAGSGSPASPDARSAGYGVSEVRFRFRDGLHTAQVWDLGTAGWWVQLGAAGFSVTRPPIPLPQELKGQGDLTLRAPMAGTITVIHVDVDQSVAAGDVLLVLEAMKMEHELRATADGVVSDLRVAPGASVAGDAVLLVLNPP
ncbi:MAG: biotin carboxylase N-terminal domain-containing protein [Pseudomonadota bacterium]